MKPRFKRLRHAIEFLADALDRGDRDAIADACAEEAPGRPPATTAGLPTAREYLLRAISQLGERHAEQSLRARYRRRGFPWIRRSFKLGGHASELGHIHVDFVRADGGWALHKIWICR